jgi:hypothetical protein
MSHANAATVAGFFVDWNGDTRCTNQTTEPFECQVDLDAQHVDVLDSNGFVIHECTYFPTLQSVREAGVIVNLIS